MTKTLDKILMFAVIAGAVFLATLYLTKISFGSAPSGLPATVATSTLAYPVATTQSLLFATSTCSARVITTTTGAVMLHFSDIQGKVPTAIAGHLQLASTTVTYDSGQYGCDAVRVISASAATVVTVSESR